MLKSSLILATATLISGLFIGAAIGRRDVKPLQEQADKTDEAFRTQQNIIAQLRKENKELKSIGQRMVDADNRNQQSFQAVKDLNLELAGRLKILQAHCGGTK